MLQQHIVAFQNGVIKMKRFKNIIVDKSGNFVLVKIYCVLIIFLEIKALYLLSI